MTKVAIVGYGNLGKACEKIAVQNKCFELIGIFTRRNPDLLTSPFGTKFYHQKEMDKFKDEVDVLVLCTGSKNDLVPLALRGAEDFNTVDAFDNHNEMKKYVSALNKAATSHNHLSIVGAGWDPGLFSLMRCLFEGATGANAHTFWGEGVSQGHSEAVRGIEGVKRAVQYTLPREDAIILVKEGRGDHLTNYDKHKRVCYVVAEDLADKNAIRMQIKNMPDYFQGYETEIHFIDEDEFLKEHCHLNHGGKVICSKNINEQFVIELDLKLDSNPDFTAIMLMSYAKCADRLYRKGERGARTILDIPVTYLFDDDRLDIIGKYL